MKFLGVIPFVVVVGAWVSAFVHGILLVSHRRPDVSIGQLVFNGWMFYSRDTFLESGHRIHRRFMISAITFFLGILLFVVGAAIATKLQ